MPISRSIKFVLYMTVELASQAVIVWFFGAHYPGRKMLEAVALLYSDHDIKKHPPTPLPQAFSFTEGIA
jgi:hypothetical protein